MNHIYSLREVIKEYHQLKKIILAINVQNIEHIKIISSQALSRLKAATAFYRCHLIQIIRNIFQDARFFSSNWAKTVH